MMWGSRRSRIRSQTCGACGSSSARVSCKSSPARDYHRPMREETALIVTSISPPNAVLQSLATGAKKHGVDFLVIGDEKSPGDFQLEGCRFYGIDEQQKLDLSFAKKCPTRHYARKNIGYLLA